LLVGKSFVVYKNSKLLIDSRKLITKFSPFSKQIVLITYLNKSLIDSISLDPSIYIVLLKMISYLNKCYIFLSMSPDY